MILKTSDIINLPKIKYIQGEFPEFFLNYLIEDELRIYPKHGRWQFNFSPIIYSKDDLLPFELKQEDSIKAINHAIISVGHIARLYYLRDFDEKTHVWVVRQLGWALKYAENGIVKLYNYTYHKIYSNHIKHKDILNEIEWLLNTNKNWVATEKLYLSSVNEYRIASLRLNKIVQFFSEKNAKSATKLNFTENSSNNYDIERHEFVASLRSDLIKEFDNKFENIVP